jgi:hypothetical protein
MALEGLQTPPAARIPHLDCVVTRLQDCGGTRRRRQPGRVVREGH